MQDNNNNEELEFNKINREQSEKIMKDSSVNLDDYWDIHNPVVIVVLCVLGIIILFGVIYYVALFLDSR